MTLAWTRLRYAVLHGLEFDRNRLRAEAGKLDVLSPLAILARGYAICQDSDGHILIDSAKVAPGDPVSGETIQRRIGLPGSENPKLI